MMRCFWFGHSPPAATKELEVAIVSEGFECRHCGKRVKWSEMPKSVLVAVIRARSEIMSRAPQPSQGK